MSEDKKSAEIKKWFRNVSMITVILLFIFKAIVEDEVQGIWNNAFKPFLIAKIPINLELPRYFLAMFFVFITIIFGLVIHTFFKMRSQIGANSHWQAFGSLELPSDGNVDLSKVDVIRAVAAARNDEMSINDLKRVIILALNANIIRPTLASELLDEFGLQLVHLPGNSFKITSKDVPE